MTGGLKWRGIYSLTETYVAGDVVQHPDTEFNYVCVSETSQGIPPDINGSGFEAMNEFSINFIDGGYF